MSDFTTLKALYDLVRALNHELSETEQKLARIDDYAQGPQLKPIDMAGAMAPAVVADLGAHLAAQAEARRRIQERVGLKDVGGGKDPERPRPDGPKPDGRGGVA